MTKTRKELIMATLSDQVSRLLYYDRKEDSALPVGAIEEAIKAGEISIDEIVAYVTTELRKGLEE